MRNRTVNINLRGDFLEQYAIYLRKSRADKELEAQSELETLSRHEAILKALAENKKLHIGKIYKEVVSGETITSRPAMQELLRDVEQGMWDGVLVMEIERLARGDTIDQGLVAQTFKYSDTLIITPNKTYNPNNEFDEEYFEFGLFMSRREYKTINRRLQSGRLQSVKEGKYVGNKPPYGYKKVKLEKEKGYTLEPIPEQAKTVQMIFNWYAYGDADGRVMGFGEIATRLHNSGILSSTGMTQWQNASIRDILSNPVYIGKIRWGLRPQKKTMVDGQKSVSRVRNNKPMLYDGLHPAIIDERTYNIVQQRREDNRKNTCPKSKSTQNPLAGLVVCKKCGRYMQRRPYQNGYTDGLICTNRYCNNVSSDLWRVEKAIIDTLKEIVGNYDVTQKENSKSDFLFETERYKKELDAHKAKLKSLQKQLDKAYEAYELGIYDSSTFLTRSSKIKKDIETTDKSIRSKEDEIEKIEQSKQQQEQFIPKIKNVIDVYYTLTSAKAKNELLKEVIERVTYSKEHSARFTKDYDNFDLSVYPKFFG